MSSKQLCIRYLGAILAFACLVATTTTAQGSVILSEAERAACLHDAVRQLGNIAVPERVREIADRAHHFGLGNYFLADIGGPATSFIVETSKIAFADILDDDEGDDALSACRQFNQQTLSYIYGYECAARTRFQDLVNQQILGQRNLMNDFTRLSNACLFFVLAHKDERGRNFHHN